MSMAVKVFEFEAERIYVEDHPEDGEDDSRIHFKIPDVDPKGKKFTVDCVANYPGDGQLAVLLASLGRHSGRNEQIAGLINFFHSVLDEASASYVHDRLLDRLDSFGIEEVEEILEWLTEQWSGERPTKSPSGSATSQPNGGRKSKATTPRSNS